MANEQGSGTDARPLSNTIAGTGPGIPDDALAPGQSKLPEPPSEAEIAAVEQGLGVEPAQRKDG